MASPAPSRFVMPLEGLTTSPLIFTENQGDVVSLARDLRRSFRFPLMAVLHWKSGSRSP